MPARAYMKIIAIIICVFATVLETTASQSRVSVIDNDMSAYKAALEQFETISGRYPTSMEGLEALLTRPPTIPTNQWIGPLFNGTLNDPWGHKFVYRCPGIHNTNSYDLYSLGGDGMSRSGGDDADDINNWNASEPWTAYYAAESRWRRNLSLFYFIILCSCVYLMLRWIYRAGSKSAKPQSKPTP
jgi:general secretion pathway protein G